MDDSGELRRRHARKEYSSEVVFTVSGKAQVGSLKNISVSGAFVIVSTPGQLTLGDVVLLRIPFTSGKNLVERRGKVRWIDAEGFAVEFF